MRLHCKENWAPNILERSHKRRRRRRSRMNQRFLVHPLRCASRIRFCISMDYSARCRTIYDQIVSGHFSHCPRVLA